MRVLVIGVGGIGAMAARQQAKAGHNVEAWEQFRLDHDRGSSYGDSRIVRRVYPDALYTALMAQAYSLWDELQDEYHHAFPEMLDELVSLSGGIFCGPKDHPQVKEAQEALSASRVAYELLDRDECQRRFPGFGLREEEVAVYEPSMGFARASRCVRAAAALARQRGAEIIEERTAARMEALPNETVRVTATDGAVFEGDALVIAAGPWMRPLLHTVGVELPLTVTRQAYVHLRPTQDIFRPGQFPVWIDIETYAYGFPKIAPAPGVKIGFHNERETATPETVERSVREADRELVRRYAAERFPLLSPEIVFEKVCLYTNTPDEDFILDAVPDLPRTFLLSGCSGHGFKFVPLLGRLAADLVCGKTPSFDLSRFRLSRF